MPVHVMLSPQAKHLARIGDMVPIHAGHHPRGNAAGAWGTILDL